MTKYAFAAMLALVACGGDQAPGPARGDQAASVEYDAAPAEEDDFPAEAPAQAAAFASLGRSPAHHSKYETTDSLTRDEVGSVVRSSAGSLRGCYQTALDATPDLGGK